MDDLTLMREFRAERAGEDPQARAAAWRALEARFEPAPAADAAVATPARRRGLFSRRRFLAFAGATALATLVAAVLVLDSGPTTEPAAARILHETAAVAASDASAPSALPGPDQYFFRSFRRLELQSWVPGGAGTMGGVMTRPGAFKALMPTTQEWWTAPDGSGRVREVAGTPRFLTSGERNRWEAAGSRLPAPFDPEYQRKYPLAFRDALELRRGVVDRETSKLEGFRFPDTSALPTDPEELRLAVESNEIPVSGFNPMFQSERLGSEETIAQLFNILTEGNPMEPQLRAAIFNALAELPRIEVDTEATDSLGRPGYAIRSVDRQTGGVLEFIFDPETAEMLAERSLLGDRNPGPFLEGIPAGSTIRETAYLETGVVDSTEETPSGAAPNG